jgi:hypothetical protein
MTGQQRLAAYQAAARTISEYKADPSSRLLTEVMAAERTLRQRDALARLIFEVESTT